ncbi:MAG: signal peptidase II [Bauldia sp.]|nr:MAG: signal peptidase II [Bauldia sp.]MBZ0229046.1 signal peptidase II [Bauldia sp.]
MAEHKVPPGPLSLLGLSVIAVTVAVDQASKALAESSLPIGERIDVLPILAFYRVHNPGIAFSFLSGFGGLGLILLPLAITAVVLGLWLRSTEGGSPVTVSFALIIGGAIGNLIDRFRYGHVIDFLLLHLGDWTLFVFNLADAALTFGPLILVVAFLWPPRGTDHHAAR